MKTTDDGKFKIDYESTYYGYELICTKCGFRITEKMKHAMKEKLCPSCGNKSELS